MSVEPDPFDLDAAGIRRAMTDLRAFMEALAVWLQGALPDRVTVDRRRDGLLSRTSHVHEITLERAEGRMLGARDKADALGSMLEQGLINDPLDKRSRTDKELAQLRDTHAVDDQLALLKAEMGAPALNAPAKALPPADPQA